MTTAAKQHRQGRKVPPVALVLGPLGAVARGVPGEVASPALAATVQALVLRRFASSEPKLAFQGALDDLKLLWGLRVALLWVPHAGTWQGMGLSALGGDEGPSGAILEALKLVASSGQRLDWPAAPHAVAALPGESLASACFQPLWHQGSLQGVLSLHFLRARAFPMGDGPLLLSLGQAFAMALAVQGAQQANAVARAEGALGQAHWQAKVARLQEESRAACDFLAKLSHELRSPLTTIVGFGSMLEDGIAGDLVQEQAVMVRRMVAAADAVTCLVDDLLDLSRLRAGGGSLQKEPVFLADLLKEQGAAMAPLMEASGLQLNLVLAEALPALSLDPRRMAQVLRNLLGNAIKHSPKGGCVSLSLSGSAKGQRIEVQDEGPGLPQALHERVFEPYFQLSSAEQSGGGLGLGLAIARHWVLAHGGTVGLHPNPSSGACFFIELPT